MITVKLKYSPGQSVWIMFDNKPMEVTIKSVYPGEIQLKHSYMNKYSFMGFGSSGLTKYENEVYLTKEDLINSL